MVWLDIILEKQLNNFQLAVMGKEISIQCQLKYIIDKCKTIRIQKSRHLYGQIKLLT